MISSICHLASPYEFNTKTINYDSILTHFLLFQVMQFGRIENNAYTLDFQYPFTAVQAFAVALANVTQRLK